MLQINLVMCPKSLITMALEIANVLALMYHSSALLTEVIN